VNRVRPYPGMVIDEDCAFLPGVYAFPSGNGLRIGRSGIKIDGQRAVLVGPGLGGTPESFQGTGLFSEGHSDVTVTGISVKGFRLAIHLRHGRGWTLSGIDASGNFTDPDFDWGDGPLAGAVLLEDIHDSRLIHIRAISNWTGLHLRDSHGNLVADSHFSHCTNVCLKFWHSCRNTVRANDLSHGIRIRPGETHARDSACVLLEAGSDDNRLVDNDCTFGGDGIFIRPLNGWHSRHNYFEGNDASYAHNNGIECWSPDNVFVRNRANYSSYGFWLGGSDRTMLLANEAAYNGVLHQNAPEPDFGHAGIAVVHGSSTHFRAVGNLLHHNRGAGLALGWRPESPARHWLVAYNVIRHNTGPALYIRDARNIWIGPNDLEGHSPLIETGENASVETHGPFGPLAQIPPVPELSIRTDGLPSLDHHTFVAELGRRVSFEAVPGPRWSRTPRCQWQYDEAATRDGPRLAVTCDVPGFHRVCLTASDGGAANLDWIHLYVTPGPWIGPGTGTGDWRIQPWGQDQDAACGTLRPDLVTRIASPASLHVRAQGAAFILEQSRLPPVSATPSRVRFWVRIRHQAVFGLQHTRQRIRVGQDAAHYVEYVREGHLFSGQPYPEAWYGWLWVEIPLAGDREWRRVGRWETSRPLAYFALIHETGEGEDAAWDLWLDGLEVV
jgi:hypothetical protein